MQNDQDQLCRSIDKLSSKIQDLTQTLPNFKHRIEHVEAWIAADSRIQEKEVTKRAMAFMREAGYQVEEIPTRKIYDILGQVTIEFDGVFVAEKPNKYLLCLVEAKHQVQWEHVVNRLQARDKFQHFLNNHVQRAQNTVQTNNVSASYRYMVSALRLFAKYDLCVFIGGTSFDPIVLDKTLAKNIACIHISNGNRYDVTFPQGIQL